MAHEQYQQYKDISNDVKKRPYDENDVNNKEIGNQLARLGKKRRVQGS
jgi:hypothetical protein